MDQTLIAGIGTLGIPLLLIGLLFVRRIAIFLFYVVLVIVGIGYLTSTGAISDIGHFTLKTVGVKEDTADTVPMVPPPEKMPAPAPAP
jgi:hypothetical protein